MMWRHQVSLIFRMLFTCVVAVEQLHATYVGCLQSETGSEYLGKQNVTSSGRPCVRWDEVQGAFRDYIRITFLALPDRNASNANNYCRNPNNDSRGVWCFVNLLGNVQFCNVPRCQASSPSTTTSTEASTTAPPLTTTPPFLINHQTTNAILRHNAIGWPDEETPEIDETISDYVNPVVMPNTFEELSARQPAGVVTESPATPNTIYLRLKQHSGFDVNSREPTTTVHSRGPQRRPFDQWEEDPMAVVGNSVSADDGASWQAVSKASVGSDKIFREDASGGVKIRTGATLLLSGQKDIDNENTRVVIQRSSHLSSFSPAVLYSVMSLLIPSAILLL